MGHPSQFQRVSSLGSVNARHSSIGRQPNFAVLNRGLHLYSARRPSRWASAHILVLSSSSILLAYNLSRRRLEVCHTSTHGTPYSANSQPKQSASSLMSITPSSQSMRYVSSIDSLTHTTSLAYFSLRKQIYNLSIHYSSLPL